MGYYDADALRDAFPGLSVRLYKTIDSTNTEARRQYEAGLHGPALLISEEQTAGRGRHGRTFYSPAETGIYMTVLFPVDASFEDARRATAKTAVSVYRGLRDVTGLSAGIKWVNDLYLYGKKICGILVETVLSDGGVKALIVGIGINLTTEDFPEELREKAGSVGLAPDRTELVREILTYLFRELRDLRDLSYLADYRGASVVLGRTVSFEDADGETVCGEAREIDQDGALLVELSDGTYKTLLSGEVSIRVEQA